MSGRPSEWTAVPVFSHARLRRGMGPNPFFGPVLRLGGKPLSGGKMHRAEPGVRSTCPWSGRLLRSVRHSGLCTRESRVDPLPFGVVWITRKLLGDTKLTIADFSFEPPDPVISSARTAGSHQPHRLFKKMTISKWLNWQAKDILPALFPFLSYSRDYGERKFEVLHRLLHQNRGQS
jgi:hypothetical protein